MEEKEEMGQTQGQESKLKEWSKVALYTGGLMALYAGASHATFEAQLDKASNLTLSKLAGLVLGGGAIVGGGMQVKDGNIMKGLGIIAVVAMLGIVIALIKGDAMFKLLG